MGCNCGHRKRRVSNSLPRPEPTGLVGEMGWKRVRYVGDEPDIFIGEVTGADYAFDMRLEMHVDMRDAERFLASEDFE